MNVNGSNNSDEKLHLKLQKYEFLERYHNYWLLKFL